jgi:hypothetical protein
MNLHTRPRGQVALGAWDREVYGVRYNVAEVEDVQRTVVGDDCDVFAESEPGGEHLFPRSRGILGKTVEASPYTNEPTALSMI